VQKPTVAELEEAHHHVEEEDAHDAPLVGHAADGHQFDGRHDVVEGDDLAHHRD
jgi:ubiquinol-cytochrome c reductase cytochrome b subunit